MASTEFTIADVLAWARTKPADERYDYFGCAGNCALDQFLIETGRSPNPIVDGYDWRDEVGGRHRLANGLDLASQGLRFGCTFGGFVKELEALCPGTVVIPSEWTRLDAYLTDIETVSA